MAFSVRFDKPLGTRDSSAGPRIGVVIPCYRVAKKIGRVLEKIGPEVSRIYCIDDGCPENSGHTAERAAAHDPRIRVIRHVQNRGVGRAVVTGYRHALSDGMDVIVKLDDD